MTVKFEITIGTEYVEALALLKLLDSERGGRMRRFSAAELAGQVVENYVLESFPDIANGMTFGDWCRRRRAGEQFTVFDGELMSAQQAQVLRTNQGNEMRKAVNA